MEEVHLEIAICDDEKIICEIEKRKCEQILKYLGYNNYNIQLFNNGLDLLNSKKRFHIYFLDVEMPIFNGFKVGKMLGNTLDTPIIIYLTSHNELIQEGYKYNAFRYLYKPIDDKQLLEGLKNAIREIVEVKSILLKDNDKKVILAIKKIMYIESLGEGCSVNTSNKYYIQKEPLKYWLQLLPEKEFVQTHRSYIVNLKYVEEVLTKSVKISGGFDIPLSIRNQKKVKDKVFNYIKSKAIKL